MKSKLLQRLEGIGRHAAKVQQWVEAAPAEAAKLRASVAATAGQLQQLRAELDSGMAGLRAQDEERLLLILREIDGAQPTLEEAGHALAGVDLELGAGGRLIVSLEKMNDVPAARLRGLADANSARPGVHALLSAIVSATEVAAGVSVQGLEYAGLTAWIGTAPRIRVSWRTLAKAETALPAVAPRASSGASSLPSSIPTVGRPGSSPFSHGTVFAPTQTAPAVVARPAEAGAAVPEVAAPPAASHAAEPAAGPSGDVPPGSDWRTSALDRFKKMPDLRKRG